MSFKNKNEIYSPSGLGVLPGKKSANDKPFVSIREGLIAAFVLFFLIAVVGLLWIVSDFK